MQSRPILHSIFKETCAEFQRIYELAKANDVPTLNQYLAEEACVDVRDALSLITPAGLLAAEGKKEAVSVLKRFGANPNSIAMGYALAGDLAEAEFYRIHYGADVNAIVTGCVLAGNDQEVERYRLGGADLFTIIQFYAFMKRHDQVERYFHFTDDDIAAEKICGCFAAEGYALAGCEKEAKDYIDLYSPELTCIASAFARARNKEAIVAIELSIDFRMVALCFAQTVWDEELASLLAQSSHLDSIAEGYALNGLKGRLRRHLAQYPGEPDLNVLFAFGGHLLELETSDEFTAELTLVCQKGLAGASNIWTTWGEIYWPWELFKNAEITLYTLSFFQSNEFRLLLAKALDQSRKLAFNAESLVAKANKISSLMKTHELNFNQAEAWLNLTGAQQSLILEWDRGALPPDIIDAIFAFTKPTLQPKEREELFYKYRLHIFKGGLLSILDKQYEENEVKDRAQRMARLATLNNEKDLSGELRGDHVNDPYLEVIEKFEKKMGIGR